MRDAARRPRAIGIGRLGAAVALVAGLATAGPHPAPAARGARPTVRLPAAAPAVTPGGAWAGFGFPGRTLTTTLPAYLPAALRAHDPPPVHPRPDLAAAVWRAVERLAGAHVTPAVFPGYAATSGGPSAAGVRANVEAACHDFPDLPDPFGAGAHHHACYEWVAGYLALYHAARARQASLGVPDGTAGGPIADDRRWAQHYLDAELDALARFVYGPEDLPAGVPSHRDSLAAIWQNPLRAVNVVVVAELLRKQDALPPATQARAEELLSGIARAWYAAFRVDEPGTHPTTGLALTSAPYPLAEARTLAGRDVASRHSFTFRWDADKGNTPAEEVGWMGAAAMLIARALGDRLTDGDGLYEAGRHWVDFTLAYDRPDPVHGGTIRTLNAETDGGAYGQRRYWLENHTADVPSLPYLGYTWQSIGTALFASDRRDGAPWQSLTPDDAAWQVMLLSAGETMRAPDGTFLVDWAPGGGIGYAMDPFPLWHMPCGQWIAGRHYVRYDGRAGGQPLYVAEIGHPAGLDVVNVAWPLMRIAAHRQDRAAYRLWADRLARVLDAYAARPPDPRWAECQIAPYVSDNPGYHAARMLSVYVMAWHGLGGHTVEPWPAARPPP